MHESTGKSITLYTANISFNVTIMNEKGKQVTQFLLLLAINYSFCDHWPLFEAMVKDQRPLKLHQKYKWY